MTYFIFLLCFFFYLLFVTYLHVTIIREGGASVVICLFLVLLFKSRTFNMLYILAPNSNLEPECTRAVIIHHLPRVREPLLYRTGQEPSFLTSIATKVVPSALLTFR